MTDDPDRPSNPASGDLASPFLFVPHGAPEPVEWMRKHPGWVKFPATFVPRAPAAVRTIPGTNRPWPLDKRGQPWPKSRFGQPLRPLDEYPPGVRAPGEGYTGPIADPDEAMRAALASKDVLAQAAECAADPDAPIRAYLSAMEVWRNPGKYAGYPRPGTVQALNADAIRAGMDRAHIARTGRMASGAGGAETGGSHGHLRGSSEKSGLVRFDAIPTDERHRLIAEVGPGLVAAQKSTAPVAYAGGGSGTGAPLVPMSDTPDSSLADAVRRPVLSEYKQIYPTIDGQSTRFKELAAQYSPDRPHYHQYDFYTYLGEIGAGATPQAAYQELLKNAVPGGEHTGTPIKDGQASTATFAGRGGTVVTFVEPETLSIFNLTQPDHILHDGFVQRQIVVSNGSMYIRTIGIGNNSSGLLAWGNEVAARPAFAASTNAIRGALYPSAPTGFFPVPADDAPIPTGN